MNRNSAVAMRGSYPTKWLSAIFILFIASLVGVISLYWTLTLEPSLKRDARSNATALAQTHARSIADALAKTTSGEIGRSAFDTDVQEILLLLNSENGQPFIRRIAIEEAHDGAANTHAESPVMSYGEGECPTCFVSHIPLFSPITRELVGVAHFYSSDAFYRETVNSVRIRLFGLSAAVLFLLLIVWWAVWMLVDRIRGSERRLDLLFESAPVPMLLVDPQHHDILRVNRLASKLVDSAYVISRSEPSLHALIEEIGQRGAIRDREVILSSRSEGQKWMMVSAYTLSDENPARAIIGMVDISAIKSAQKSLENAKDQAEAASRSKSEFLATMSHEIRTPMNGVLGMTQLLKKGDINEQQREYLDAITKSGEALLVLLNDILDLSRMEAGRLEIRCDPFEPRAVVDELAELMLPLAREKGLALTVAIDQAVPARVSGDAARLRQVLLNLLGNAIKFTLHGGITISVEMGRTEADNNILLRFAVHDTGMGIPEDVQELVFERFTQGDQTISRRFGGAGLGLAITKRLVQMMGGDITLHSSAGVGSTFTFTILVADAGAQAEVIPSISAHVGATAKPGRPLKILVAEDVEINRRVVKGLLQADGHHVAEASDGQEAVDKATTERFDAILMDLQMPILDGYQATQLIRSDYGAASRNSPILALTANVIQDEQRHCQEAGMDGFIIKPFTQEKLLAELARVAGEDSRPLKLNIIYTGSTPEVVAVAADAAASGEAVAEPRASTESTATAAA